MATERLPAQLACRVLGVSHLFVRDQGTAAWPGWSGLCGAADPTDTLDPGRKQPPCEVCTKVISLD